MASWAANASGLNPEADNNPFNRDRSPARNNRERFKLRSSLVCIWAGLLVGHAPPMALMDSFVMPAVG